MKTLIAIAIICLIVLVLILRKGLIDARRAGREQDNRMDDIINGRHRYKYPK